MPALSADCKELTLDVDVLVNGINKTIFATADDELRPVMNGVYINLAPSMLTFVGTDAHKLVKYESEAENEVSASFILPKKPANLLKSVLLKEEDAIKVSFDSKNAMFQLKSHTLVCRLIEGNYPNYNAVIPAANPNKVLVDRIELVNGIKRVAVCSNPTTNLIRMDIGDNRINLTAQDIDFSVSANETISAATKARISRSVSNRRSWWKYSPTSTPRPSSSNWPIRPVRASSNPSMTTSSPARRSCCLCR